MFLLIFSEDKYHLEDVLPLFQTILNYGKEDQFYLSPKSKRSAPIPGRFLRNHGLCGEQLGALCKNGEGSTFSQSPNSAQDSKKRYSGRLLISASATVGALLLVALMCFWGCFLYKRLGKNNIQSLAVDVSGGASVVMFHGDLPYSSKDIIKKLETLNGEHVIGSEGFGTVYRLAMDDGNVFALKRIVNVNEGFDRFFERELAILGSIKHRYLVNLRGYCNSPTSKLLIYDFLTSGNLDDVLHERSEPLETGMHS